MWIFWNLSQSSLGAEKWRLTEEVIFYLLAGSYRLDWGGSGLGIGGTETIWPRAAFVWSFHFGTWLESVSQNSNKKMWEEYVQEESDNPSTMKTLWSYHSAGFSLFQSQWESNISQDGSPENWGIDNG